MTIGSYTRQLLRERKFKEALVHFLIDNRWFQNVNRFNLGDQVRYNWKSKWYLWPVIAEKWGQTFIVTSVWRKGENVDYINDGYGKGCCNVFWLRPAIKSERIDVPAREPGEQV